MKHALLFLLSSILVLGGCHLEVESKPKPANVDDVMQIVMPQIAIRDKMLNEYAAMLKDLAALQDVRVYKTTLPRMRKITELERELAAENNKLEHLARQP